MPSGAPLPFWWIALVCLAFIWLPGNLIARSVRLPRSTDWPLRTSLEIGLGLAFWPLLLLWSTVLAGFLPWQGWTAASARIAAIGIAVIALVYWGRELYRHSTHIQRSIRKQNIWLMLFGFLLLLAVVTRLQHIHSLVLPNWVDSIHHVMIVRLIMEHGVLPTTYEPFIQHSTFSYHWGFHALIAWLAWTLDNTDSFDIARLILIVGQMLNVLMLWALYAAGRVLFNSRRAGMLAAALGMFVSWLPAYYTAWGRYTHLAGILIAVPCLIALWRVANSRTHVTSWWIIVIVTATGLALTHVRVAAFSAIFAALLLAWLLINRRWRVILRWATAVVASVILILPWLNQLASHPRAAQTLITASSERISWNDAVSSIPWGLVWVPGIRELTLLATGGLSELLASDHSSRLNQLASIFWLILLVAVAVWRIVRSDRQSAFPWISLALLYGWSASVFVLLNTHVAGLPRIAFLSLGAAAITFFAPVSLSASGLVTWATDALVPQRWATITTVAITVAVAIGGAANMRDIINPRTVLADAEDLPALQWIRDNTPLDARFAVDAWLWQGNTYAGADAGYWIPVLTDRYAITPPALYTLTASRAAALEANRILEDWTSVQSANNDAIVTTMRAHNLSHLYVGHRTRHLDPAQLAQSHDLELLYDKDEVYIYRLKDHQENLHE